MSEPAFSLCVYCGSRPGNDPAYEQAAIETGQWIGSHGGQLVYGGGNNGLMGTVAKATKDAGGRVVGIIPKALVDRELANTDCDELYIVDTMHERKAMMGERANAFVALPGGIGTFEEMFEIWTWRQLGYHNKPLGLLSVAGYYDGLSAFLKHGVAAGFMNEWQMGLIEISSDLPGLLTRLVERAGVNQSAEGLRENL